VTVVINKVHSPTSYHFFCVFSNQILKIRLHILSLSFSFSRSKVSSK
jgi:hypothetical protein